MQEKFSYLGYFINTIDSVNIDTKAQPDSWSAWNGIYMTYGIKDVKYCGYVMKLKYYYYKKWVIEGVEREGRITGKVIMET